MKNSKAGYLETALTLYAVKNNDNGFYSISETWNELESKKWGVRNEWDYMRATSKLKTIIADMNKSRAQYHY